MPANIVVGSQWGDEGKGKIIDIMASRADVVVRATGGNNAGHTVVNNGEVYKLHLIPSGILYPETLCLIGAGVVLDPKDFISELDSLESRGISTANLKIDPRAHVVMPWHIELDGLSEKFRGNSDIGAVKTAIRSLKDGWNLLLFPEGTRVREPGTVAVKGGAAMIAIRSGVQMLPVFIGRQKKLFSRVPIIFGKPYDPQYTGRKGTAEEYQANAEEVMRQAYALGGIS